MARHVIHGIVGCLASNVAKIPDRWKHNIKESENYKIKKSCPQWDSNPLPLAYLTDALANCAMKPHIP